MNQIANLPYATLVFTLDDNGKLQTPPLPEIAGGVTDLLILSHGWHEDAPDSQKLYETLVGNLVEVDAGRFDSAHRRLMVIGLFWPSDRFRDDLGRETIQAPTGQAQAMGAALQTAALAHEATEIAQFLKIKDPAQFLRTALRATQSPPDADSLAKQLREAVDVAAADAQTLLDHEDLVNRPGRDLVKDLAQAATPHPPVATPAGQAAAITSPVGTPAAGQAQDFFGGITAGVARLLNQFAYFELKNRAGLVGAALGGLLDAPELGELRIHLVGHSFGGRLVTAAAQAMTQRKLQSLTLLQAAFSHNSFGALFNYPAHYQIKEGGFRGVIANKRVVGPISITHTWNDHAVGLAYPAASRVSQTIADAFTLQVSSSFGGETDVFGGLGANGALGLSNGEGSDRPYDGIAEPTLQNASFINNLHCDFITEHSDVARIECARILHVAVSS